jgi:hypothetical protein
MTRLGVAVSHPLTPFNSVRDNLFSAGCALVGWYPDGWLLGFWCGISNTIFDTLSVSIGAGTDSGTRVSEFLIGDVDFDDAGR